MIRIGIIATWLCHGVEAPLSFIAPTVLETIMLVHRKENTHRSDKTAGGSKSISFCGAAFTIP